MLKSDVIWPNSRRFKSRTEWEPLGFFSEALCNSTQFDLKLGFFSSSAINVLADGFAAFLYNGGKMRMIINDILSTEDKRAIIVADSCDDVDYFNLQDLGGMSDTLSKRNQHFFECLAWLIRHNRIEIKVVVPKAGEGIAHSKCGVFFDGLNRVAFDGSWNFSKTALIANIESITAFCDWDGQSDVCRIKDVVDDFERTFFGNDESVTYLDTDHIRTHITDTYKNKDIQELLADEAQLINDRLENDLPKTVTAFLGRAKNKVKSIIERIHQNEIQRGKEAAPRFPYSQGPREYQHLAFENWKANKQKGLFAMATGTGKTITSLNCLLEIYKRCGYYKAIILVPTITLVGQWEEECKKFNFRNVIRVCSKNSKWAEQIETITLSERLKGSDNNLSYIIISTYASFIKDKVFKSLSVFPKTKLLLIADEAHNMGSRRMLNILDGIPYLRRIGLSATPERQFEEEANQTLYHFFGAENGFTYEYSMQEAIDKGVLCRYYYYPHVVRLTMSEMEEYMRISVQLAKFFNNNHFADSNEILTALLLKRKRIIHKAENKLEVFRNILEQRFQEKGNLKYTLVYVPEGLKPDTADADVYDDTDQLQDDDYSEKLINEYTAVVSGIDSKVTVRKFTSGIKEREELLKGFADGNIEVLTSMKCLDEGVDVPRSELAIFCASTGNPRQFIQRRGRILRKHPDKHMAVIHDLVVAPEVNIGEGSYAMERSLMATELRRVRNFSLLSENSDDTINELEDIMNYYNLSLF